MATYEETSWADQWDYGDGINPFAQRNNTTTGNYNNNKKKTGLQKAKAVAFSGLGKLKQFTVGGFRWLKLKYNQRKRR